MTNNCLQAFVNEVRQQPDAVESDVQLDQFLPPIRQTKEKSTAHETAAYDKTDRIKSCDYDKWSKYDPGILLDCTLNRTRTNFHPPF